MPMNWDSPVALPVPAAMAMQASLRAIGERELTDDNFDRFWCNMLVDGCMTVNGKRLHDADEVQLEIVREFMRDCVGFTYWRS